MTEQSSVSAESGGDAVAPAAINPVDVRLAAMNLLARREHSLHELRQKLRRRFPDESVLALELARLQDENLQSDQRYAESYLRQRSARGYGPQRVRREMRDKGLPDEQIADAFAATEVDWCELAAQVMRKKFGAAPATELKEKARRLRFMQYRGFHADHYRHILEQ
jgi:regulatory protein